MAEEIWDVASILKWTEGYFEKNNDSQPRLSAQILTSEALGITRMELFCDMHRPLSLDERATLREWVVRRAHGEPLQYITGRAPFRHLNLKIKKGVLVPRPETEVLVSEALALLDAPSKPQDAYDEHIIRLVQTSTRSHQTDEDTPDLNGYDEKDDTALLSETESLSQEKIQEKRYLIADICTGSGCIACSLAYEHPSTDIIATDISPQALDLAKENAHLYDLDDRIIFVEGNLGSCIDPSNLGKFDMILSNPPYIPTKLIKQLPDEVKDYEPILALDGGDDGLDIFKELLHWTKKALKDEGVFLVELHEDCLETAQNFAKNLGFKDVRIIKDLAQANRILTGKK